MHDPIKQIEEDVLSVLQDHPNQPMSCFQIHRALLEKVWAADKREHRAGPMRDVFSVHDVIEALGYLYDDKKSVSEIKPGSFRGKDGKL